MSDTLGSDNTTASAVAAEGGDMSLESLARKTMEEDKDALYWEEISLEPGIEIERAKASDFSGLPAAIEQINQLKRSLARRDKALEGVRRIYHADIHRLRDQIAGATGTWKRVSRV